MKTAGIIAEYNPFHNGHAWQIRQLKQRGFDAVVCVCSPGVVQRGEAALLPTCVRTRAVLAGGADLVLSLPAPYATLSAEGFAAAGVSLLDALGCVDVLCFGVQTSDPEEIFRTAAALEDPAFVPALRSALDAGRPLAAARAEAAEALCPGAGEVLRRPNDILGVEYCRALRRIGSAITPLALERQGAAHDAPLDAADGRYASASALRALMLRAGASALAPHVPAACLPVYLQAEAEGAVLDPRAFSTAVLSRLRAVPVDTLRTVRGVSEGLENRLAQAVRSAGTWDALIDAMKTSRYATARLRRLALDAALGYTEDLPAAPPYLHVLGATDAGLSVLRRARDAARLPLSHSLARLAACGPACAHVAQAHAAAEDLVALCLRTPRPVGTAYTTKPLFGVQTGTDFAGAAQDL